MILNTIILNTDTAEIQKIIKNLDSTKDVLLLFGDFMAGEPLEVQYIKPINDVITLGVVDGVFLQDVIEEYGDVSLSVAGYTITFNDGMYGIELEIEIVPVKEEETPVKKNLPLPVLVVVGVVTALLTAVLIVLKIIKKLKK